MNKQNKYPEDLLMNVDALGVEYPEDKMVRRAHREKKTAMQWSGPGEGTTQGSENQYLVVFTVKFKDGMWDDALYKVHSTNTNAIVISQPGFIKVVDIRDGDRAVSISYWETMDAIHAWSNHPEHLKAKEYGRKHAYEDYSVEICEIKRQY